MSAIRNLMILLVLLCTGCAAVVVGGAAAVGSFTYVAGQLKKTYNADLDTSFRASLAGCESLGMPILDREKQLSQATIKTQDGDRDVWITLKTQSSTTTEISIRVGYLGDEQASRRIHDAIGAKL